MIGRELTAMVLVAAAACGGGGGGEVVGVTMELSYDPDACGGCSASDAMVPGDTAVSLKIAEAGTDLGIASKCFVLSAATSIAAMPERFENSEFNGFQVPGDRVLYAIMAAYPPGIPCGDISDAPVLEAVSEEIDVSRGDRAFVLIVNCLTSLCAM